MRARGERAGIDWSKQPLGEISDAELGRRLGVHTSGVRSARVARKVPRWGTPKTHRKKGIDWDAVEDLGKIPDTQIAKRVGVLPSVVRMARVKRGIGPAVPRPGWPAAPAGGPSVFVEWPKSSTPLADWARGGDSLLADPVTAASGVAVLPFRGAVVTPFPAPPPATLTDVTRETGVMAALADLAPEARVRVLRYALAMWPVTP